MYTYRAGARREHETIVVELKIQGFMFLKQHKIHSMMFFPLALAVAAAPQQLPALSIDPDLVTISGISSGAGEDTNPQTAQIYASKRCPL